MESRYALREFEGAIGYDCRLLEDGRKAVFWHTWIHRRCRRDILERRDLISVMQCGIMSSASILSHGKIDVDSAIESIDERRRFMLRIAFPYVRFGGDAGKDVDYDRYFDELDEIEASKKASAAHSAEASYGLPTDP